MGMEDIKSLDERTGWAFLWTGAEWVRHFLVLTPGVLTIYPSIHRSNVEKTVLVDKCAIGLHKPLPLTESKSSKYSLKKRIWKNLLKLVLSDQIFSQTDLAVISIRPRRGKTCYLMFPSEAEAEVWKAGIEESIVLVTVSDSKKVRKKWRRSKAMQQASDAFDQTKTFLQTKSLLIPPFGLRWQAYSPLFKVREAKQTASLTNPCKGETVNANAAENVNPACIKANPIKPLWYDLESLNGCTNFLCSSYLNLRALEHTSLMVDHFKGSYQMGDSSLPDELRLEAWKGTAHRIVKALVDQLLLNNPSLEPCISNDELLDQLWCASEVWVFGAVHDKIMGACKQMFAIQDASLNNILARLEKVDPEKLGVRAEFEVLVLGEALDEFRRLNQFRTPYEKAMCLRKTVLCIINGIQSLIKSCTGALKDTEGLLPCTDDLLSFMLLLMARAKVRNLHANACYMENFINLQKDTNRGELVYHITNFMAACKYLQSEAVQQLLADISLPPKTAVSQMQALSCDSRSSSPSFCRSSSSFVTSSSSRVDSLDLEANESRWEEACDKSSCFDQEAFCNNWRGSDSLNGRDFPELETIEDDFNPDKAWFMAREGLVKDGKLKSYLPYRSGRRVLALPGESPDFLLAPTYQ
ncbi:hypothetical protein GOP47_0015726 [Adiantum capillus-veneris]|uniref:VPS9 domain-containing protein n=1 Tax=Adiantum capillus-veneris TaxID=13818 RepID=A0A9D4UKB1_ADICA|nr:hypothetical protein GOP47_0015726 [Adiantum capillus-veneris]